MLRFVFCLLLLCSPCLAQHPAVARIRVPEGRGITSYGTGTLVDKNDQHGLIVTNCHVVRDSQGTITVSLPNDPRSPYGAKILGIDPTWDLAALLIYAPQADPVPFADAKPGEELEIAGYGSGDYFPQRGYLHRYVAPAPGAPGDWMKIQRAIARQGDSGGPVFNSEGYYVGTLWGSDFESETTATCAVRVCQFLGQWSNSCGSGGCYQGYCPPQAQPQYNPAPRTYAQPVRPATPQQQASGGLFSKNINQSISAGISDQQLEKLADILTAKMAQDPRFKGPPGRDGQPGLEGAPGKDGPPGPGPDLDKLAQMIVTRLPPITINYIGADNTIYKTVPLRLGDTLNVPPQRMQIQHPGGQVYYQEKPLGDWIALELAPLESQK